MNNNSIEEDEIDIGKIFLHLKKNLAVIFLITILIGSLTTVYVYFLQPIYSSSVSVSFSNQKMSQLSSLIPNELSEFTSKESELETVKLTLQTRKFINSVIKNLNLEKHYFIKTNYKRDEVYNFKNLKVSLEINNKRYISSMEESLYNELFEIVNLDNNRFILKIEKLKYQKIHYYGKEIQEKFFTLSVLKLGKLIKKPYFITLHDKTLLADEILKNMTVSILSGNVLKISYRDTVALRAKEVVDAIAKKFIAYTLAKKNSELSQTLNFLEIQIANIELHLKGEGDKLKSYQQKSESFLSMESGKVLFASITEKEEESKKITLQLKELKSFKRGLQKNRLNTVSLLNSGIQISSIQSLIELFRTDTLSLNEMKLQSSNIEKSITQNSQLSMLIQSLNVQIKLLDELKFNFTEGHPQVIKAESDLIQIREEIRSYIAMSIKRLKQSQRLTKSKISNNILMTQQNITSRLKVLKKDLLKNSTLLESLPEKDLTIQELKRKFTLSENIYTFLLQKKMEIEISKASTIANTQIIEDPIEALKPIKPNKKLIVLIGLILGLILGILFTGIRAMLDSKIRDASIIEELTDAPLYGILPMKKNQRFFDEALRAIRTNLQFVLTSEKKCTTMLISSSIAGEGKTTVIAGLGNMISHTGKKTLLMDLDLRKPRLFKELGQSNQIGMTQYLVNDFDLFDLIQPVSENLDFFAAGAVPPNPSELLMSEKFHKTIQVLMEQYDYILFDTAPIGSVIDANMLLKHSDILLLVVKANVTEKIYLEHFNRLRAEKNIKSSGIILNQVKSQKSDAYGYGYGYGYGKEDK